MQGPRPRIIYSPAYDIHFMGLEKLHPFDSRKYSRAYSLLQQQFAAPPFNALLEAATLSPEREISQEELLWLHTPGYLQQLRSSRYVAQAVELPFLAPFPFSLIDAHLLAPMRLATMGTVLAAEQALQHGIAVNMGGGYHHASAAQGEGFCLYADVPLAVLYLRRQGLLAADDPLLILDLDVHQGNGHERVFMQDPNVYIMDVYNAGIYPGDTLAMQAITCNVPLPSGTGEPQYLDTLRTRLPALLKDIPPPRIAFYIAGTDVYTHDLLGQFNLSPEGILQRDQFVFQTLLGAGIPTAMTLGGGYSQESYRFIAATLAWLLQQWGG